jgi:ribosomal protein L21E
MSKFKYGDYVVYTYNFDRYSPGETLNKALYGKIGKVVDTRGPSNIVDVEFLEIVRNPDGEIVGHRCHGNAKPQHGWEIYIIYLRHLTKDEREYLQNTIYDIEKRRELNRLKFLEVDPYGEDDWEDGMFEGRSVKGLEYKGKLYFPQNPYLNTNNKIKQQWRDFIKESSELKDKVVEFYEIGDNPIYKRLLCKRINIITLPKKIRLDKNLPNGGLFKMIVIVRFIDYFDRSYEVEMKLSKGISYYDKVVPEPLKNVEKWWLENSTKNILESFEVGDEVVFIDDGKNRIGGANKESLHKKKGRIISLSFRPDYCNVEFEDRIDGGHSCGGRGKRGHCMLVDDRYLKKVEKTF